MTHSTLCPVLLPKGKSNKMSIYSIPHRELNEKLAEQLKKIPEFEISEWAFFVKSSVARARPTQEPDFWYKRAASIL